MITKKIKELYRTQTEFCNSIGIDQRDFSKKMKSVNNKIEWLNSFLDPLGLEVEVKEK